ncbi:MAG: hypothetical protein HOO91_04295 [Bacteroidales bacterium]|nr:hypothetical protein [Bacteroidales bacterium]
MKNIFLSPFKLIIVGCIISLFNANAIGQISISPDGTFGVCPGSQSNGAGFTYTANLIDNYFYTWTVTNGFILE